MLRPFVAAENSLGARLLLSLSIPFSALPLGSTYFGGAANKKLCKFQLLHGFAKKRDGEMQRFSTPRELQYYSFPHFLGLPQRCLTKTATRRSGLHLDEAPASLKVRTGGFTQRR